MSVQHVFDIEASTLAELRALVERTADMAADSPVRVRTRLGANGNGSLLKRVHVAEADRRS